MILSDALVAEIYQTLSKLPYDTVAQLIGKLQHEASHQAQPAPTTQAPAPANGHRRPGMTTAPKDA